MSASRSPKPLAAFFALAGILHFLRPSEYEAIVPPPVPARAAVALSGAAEVAGGLALLSPRTRPLARAWLLALLVAVFPANVYMALAPARVAERGVAADRIPRVLLWLRLPLQGLAMAWVWRVTER